ncbi:MAG: hypothetical protein PHQ40_00330 [Anaerolineaceae bacterium]|nr:hypothetical protein [Anaerolineaceae bacterium]MDD5367502.1 hypothetical protein [Anaerolineaceae bacterium]
MLNGTGYWIWNIPNCKNGDAAKIAETAEKAGWSHVLVKIADGQARSNLKNTDPRVDLVPPVVDALHAAEVQVWGWHYVYGYYPLKEAKTSIERVQGLGLDGFVVNAEKEYKLAGPGPAQIYMTELRRCMGENLPIALSSYRYPHLHPDFPFNTFLTFCNYAMPQVYWEQAHNPTSQLTGCLADYAALKVVRPVIPTGPTYQVGGWAPTLADIQGFEAACRAHELPAWNWFSWDEAQRDLPEIWSYLTRPVPTSEPPKPEPEQHVINLPLVMNN